MKGKCKLVKVISSILLAAVCLLVMAGGVWAKEEEKENIDFVLVLDCSKSMDSSDPESLSISAAKMFVDMLPVENTRVAVVGFGPEWGKSTYVLDYDSKTDTMSKVAYDLIAVSTQEKAEVKNSVEAIKAEGAKADGDLTYTQVGYALETANDILQKNNSKKNSACIVLMSDGRLTEKESIKKKDAYKSGNMTLYKSVENAVDVASENEWPVYCLELNYDGLKSGDSWMKNTAIQQMTRIAEGTGGKRIEVNSPSQIDEAFTEIFSRFFENDNFEVSNLTLHNGKAEKEFNVPDMTAEASIIISGTETAQIDSVEITDPKGVSKKYEKSEQSDSRIITFENKKYIMIKLLQPTVGQWSVAAYGKDGITIKVMSTSIQEMNLHLTTQQDTEGTLQKGKPVEFTASFVYNGISYSSEKFYQDNPAFLEIVETGDRFEMTSGADNYKGTVTFNDSGVYTVRAVVESGYFRNDRKESETFTFSVDNLPTEASGTMENQEMGLNDKKEIDCTKYFSNPDNDTLYYDLQKDATSGITGEFDEKGVLTLKTGEKAGEYEVTVTARDGGMDETVNQTFVVTIANQPAKTKGSDKIKCKVSYNTDSLPKWLLKITGVDSVGDAVINCEEEFEDPDGIPLVYDIKDLGNTDVVEIANHAEDNGTIDITGKAKGEVEFTLQATDASDSSVVLTKTVSVDSVDMKAYVWSQVKWKVIAVLVILIVIIVLLISLFAGRKIYGVWDVAINGEYEEETRLSSLAAGKKSKVSLNVILNDLNLSTCDSDHIILKAGNNWNQKVTIIGLENAQNVYFNRDYDQMSNVIKKAVLKKGSSIEIEINGDMITLKRY